jgi:predicted O-methyltransferase YrrM
MEVLQVPEELARAVEIFEEEEPRRVLEIGCWDGGTLREWLQAATPPEVVVAISLEHRQPEAYAGWTQEGTKLVVGTGDSTSDEMKEIIQQHAPYDWAFIDGEHAYSYVREDCNTAEPLMVTGGVLLLHDITPSVGLDSCGPLEVFKEYQALGWETEVIEVGERKPWTQGIGVVYVP